MEALIKLVAEKTGISTQQAETAVHTVVGFLKDKLPVGLGQQLESFTNSGTGATDTSGSLGDIAGKIGGMFGGK